jgi:methionine synthase I (cobalamin-dependent)
METILIHPDNVEQLKTVKAVLKALKVPFESQTSTLPLHVSESINKSIKQFEAGQTISLHEFKEKHFSKK